MNINNDQNLQIIRLWKQGCIGFIQLLRPQEANAYNQALLTDLDQALEQVEGDDEIHNIVITGSGNRSFCAGADLNEMQGKDYRVALNLKSAEIFARIARCSKVTLAAINGAAVGGGLELALACDIRIAADNARFFFPEPLLGLIPAAGGTQRLPQIVGVARAKELVLGGRIWDATDALRVGLVSEVTSPDKLLPRAQMWGEEIAKRNPLSLHLAKRAIDAGAENALGYSFEAVAEALLYQLRLKKQDGKDSL